MRTLVLGYGNRSRTDDGVGWFVLERLGELGLPNVELHASHQLDVDYAERITGFDEVIFVDAAIPQSPQPIARTVVQPCFRSHAVAHYLTPSDLLALAQTLFGRTPRGILFSIRGSDFNFGTTLSPATERAGRDVVRQIEDLLSTSGPPEAEKRGLAAHA
ncbi:MAG: hydrogenase maturation protease [Verrucomicrobiia bacterium]|jgi:hydrogenase maturation protease